MIIQWDTNTFSPMTAYSEKRGKLGEPQPLRLYEALNKKVLEDALDRINAISGYIFDWKKGNTLSGKDVGLMADEIKHILPYENVVTKREDGSLAMKYDRVIPLLVQGQKEEDAKVNQILARLESIEQHLNFQ